MNEQVTRLVPTKPDAEIAEELRKKAIAAAGPILQVLDEAKDAGFELNFIFGVGGLGKNIIQQLKIVKIY